MYIASTKKRILAYLLDQIITYLFYLPLIIKVGLHYLKTGSGHEILIPWSWLISIISLHTIFQVICLYVLRGLPAQWLLGLRVVSVYHPEIGLSLSQCFIHAIVEKLKFFIGNALYYSAFWNRERRHFINLLAETKVVQKVSAEGLLKPRMALGSILFIIAMLSSLYENANLIKYSKFKSTGWIIENF
jgi:uncharacterized RDD family membrane protein YckC